MGERHGRESIHTDAPPPSVRSQALRLLFSFDELPDADVEQREFDAALASHHQ